MTIPSSQNSLPKLFDREIADPLLKRHGNALLKDAIDQYIAVPKGENEAEQAENTKLQGSLHTWIKQLLNCSPQPSTETAYLTVAKAVKANKPKLKALLQEKGLHVPTSEQVQQAQDKVKAVLASSFANITDDKLKELTTLIPQTPGVNWDYKDPQRDGEDLRKGHSLLHVAASKKEHLELLQQLVKTGANANLKDDRGNTPLHDASLFGLTNATEALLDAGADPNLTDDYGQTPLHNAALQGRTETVRVSLSAGVDPNLTNDNGQTPLHSAALQGRTETVRVLLSAGADPNLTDDNGETPLHSAVRGRRGSIDTVRVLLSAEADPNLKDNNGKTPLHNAVKLGRINTVRVLLDAGADPNLKDNKDETPKQLANLCPHSQRRQEIRELLN